MHQICLNNDPQDSKANHIKHTLLNYTCLLMAVWIRTPILYREPHSFYTILPIRTLPALEASHYYNERGCFNFYSYIGEMGTAQLLELYTWGEKMRFIVKFWADGVNSLCHMVMRLLKILNRSATQHFISLYL